MPPIRRSTRQLLSSNDMENNNDQMSTTTAVNEQVLRVEAETNEE